jgi:hypothetical protein
MSELLLDEDWVASLPPDLREVGTQIVLLAGAGGWPAVVEALGREFEQRDLNELRQLVVELGAAEHHQEEQPAGLPAPGRLRAARRVMLLVLLIGAVILLALVAGVLDHPVPAGPVDPGTPSTVTTIGGGHR